MIYKALKILAAILGVLSSAFGVYSFLFQNTKSKIVYSINQYKVTDKNISSDLNIYDSKNVKITDDVYLSYIYIWNTGSRKVDNSDILRPISINLDEGARILDAKVTKQTHDDIIKANIFYNNMDAVVSFENIEPGFGIKIKVLYSVKANPNINVSGFISESPEVREIIPRDSEKFRSKFFIYEAAFLFIFCSFMGFIGSKIYTRFVISKFPNMSAKFSFITFLISVAILGTTSSLIAIKFAEYGYELYNPSPPKILLGP